MLSIPKQIEELLKADSIKKNIRISFPFDDIPDICNDRVVSESLQFTESFCSQDSLKFGLCEASSLSFECFDVGNIKNKKIDVQIEIDCSEETSTVLPLVRGSREIELNKFKYAGGMTFFINGAEPNSIFNGERNAIGSSWAYREPFEVQIDELGCGVFSIKGSTPIGDTTIKVRFESSCDSVAATYKTSDIEGSDVADDVDFIFYPIPLGRFVVDNCKRDSTNAQKRQVEAYSEIASYDWSVPESIQALYNYSWVRSETLKLSGQDVIDILSPRGCYDRNHNYVKESTRTTTYHTDDGDVIVTRVYYNLSLPYNRPCLFTYRMEGYKKGEYKAFIDAMSGYGIKTTWQDKQIDADRFVYYSEPYLNQQTHICGDFGTEKTIVIPYDDDAHSVLLMIKDEIIPNTPYSMSNNYSKVKLEGGVMNPSESITSIKVLKEVHINTNVYKICDNLGYNFNYLETDDPLFTFKSKSFVNNNVVKYDNGTPQKRKRTDFGFEEDLDKYFKDGNFQSYVESYLELQGSFGRINRKGQLETDFLKRIESLIVGTFKVGTGHKVGETTINAKIDRTQYSNCWYDDELTKPYSKVMVNFKNADDEDEYAEYLIINVEETDEDGNLLLNPDDYLEYDITDNKIIQDNKWTQETIMPILEKIARKIEGIVYMPFDIEMKGMPQLEAGDSVKVLLSNGSFTSFVLRQTISGIQSLKSSITSD